VPHDLREQVAAGKLDLISLVLGRAFDADVARSLTLLDLCKLPAGECVLVVRDADGKLTLRKPEDMLHTFDGQPITLSRALDDLGLTLVEVRARR
jgi:hypothetical protein